MKKEDLEVKVAEQADLIRTKDTEIENLQTRLAEAEKINKEIELFKSTATENKELRSQIAELEKSVSMLEKYGNEIKAIADGHEAHAKELQVLVRKTAAQNAELMTNKEVIENKVVKIGFGNFGEMEEGQGLTAETIPVYVDLLLNSIKNEMSKEDSENAISVMVKVLNETGHTVTKGMKRIF